MMEKIKITNYGLETNNRKVFGRNANETSLKGNEIKVNSFYHIEKSRGPIQK